MRPVNFTISCAVIALGGLIVGCASEPAGSMSKKDLAQVRQSQAKVQVGDTKDKALAAYGNSNKVRMAAASIEGASIEEWKIEAFNDDGDRGRDLFVTFLYFRNGVLVDMSDKRLDFRQDAGLVSRWGKAAGKP